MGNKTLTMSEDVFVNMLKSLPEDVLMEVFWRSVVESDVSPLTLEEKEQIKKSKTELEKGETVKWEDLK